MLVPSSERVQAFLLPASNRRADASGGVHADRVSNHTLRSYVRIILVNIGGRHFDAEQLQSLHGSIFQTLPGPLLLNFVGLEPPGNYSAPFSSRKLLALVQLFVFVIRETQYAHTRRIPITL